MQSARSPLSRHDRIISTLTRHDRVLCVCLMSEEDSPVGIGKIPQKLLQHRHEHSDSQFNDPSITCRKRPHRVTMARGKQTREKFLNPFTRQHYGRLRLADTGDKRNQLIRCSRSSLPCSSPSQKLCKSIDERKHKLHDRRRRGVMQFSPLLVADAGAREFARILRNSG